MGLNISNTIQQLDRRLTLGPRITGSTADVIAMLLYFVSPSFRSQPEDFDVIHSQTAALEVLQQVCIAAD